MWVLEVVDSCFSFVRFCEYGSISLGFYINIIFFLYGRLVMIWIDEKDFIMLIVMVGEGVFDVKVGFRERGSIWKSVVVSFNCYSV